MINVAQNLWLKWQPNYDRLIQQIQQASWQQILAVLVLVTAFFPYVSPLPTASDLQPICLAFLVGLFVLSEGKYLMSLRFRGGYMSLLFFGFLLFQFLSYGLYWAIDIRRLAIYLSLALTCYFGYRLHLDKQSDLSKWVLVMVLVYAGVALIQQLVDHQFGGFMLHRVNTSSSRGVTSLAPEPSTYGFQCLLIMAFTLVVLKPSTMRKWILALLILQMMLLARSALASLCLLCMIMLCQKRWSMKWIAVLGLGLVVWSILLEVYWPGSRIGLIWRLAINDPSYLLATQVSVYSRVADIYYSIGHLFHDFPLAFGRNIASTQGMVEYFRLSEIDIFNGYRMSNKIQSGIGGVIFENGFLGLLFPFGIMVMGILTRRVMYIGLAFSLCLIFINSAHPAMPLFGIVIGCLEAEARKTRDHFKGLKVNPSFQQVPSHG